MVRHRRLSCRQLAIAKQGKLLVAKGGKPPIVVPGSVAVNSRRDSRTTRQKNLSMQVLNGVYPDLLKCVWDDDDIFASQVNRCASTSNRNFEGPSKAGGRTDSLSQPRHAAASGISRLHLCRRTRHQKLRIEYA